MIGLCFLIIISCFPRFFEASTICQTWDFALHLQDSVQFTLRSCESNSPKIIPASIPGTIQSDLISANIISVDPYYRYEEKNISWISSQCWIYESSSFNLDQYNKACDIYMNIAGLDSVANVYFNDQLIGSANNAHRDHTFIVPAAALKSRGNSVAIKLYSALDYAKDQASKYPYPVPATQNYNVWAEPTSRNFIRKAGSDFGWDWGPAFIQTGIEGGIWFYQSTEARLLGMTIEQDLKSDFSEVVLSAKVGVSTLNSASPVDAISFSLYLNDKLQRTGLSKISCSNDGHGCIVDVGSIKIPSPKLWWPREYGEQNLYSVKIELADGQSVTRRIGIRSIRLIQDAIPNSPNEVTFYITVNNVPIFVRGANFIPIDSFNSRVSRSDREYILRSSVEANMNMLRVWGGGIYQPDDFYDLADELGIMIWQEVMLACALYPRDDAFLLEVTKEVKQQALRLGTHPSIVVWGGNNEDEVALGWFSDSIKNRDLYVSDYSKLYADTVYPALTAILGSSSTTNQVIWVDSSPSNGLLSVNPYVKQWGTASTAAKGDVHFYDYSCDCENYKSFPEAKFVSEFGFQVMPSFLAYEPVTEKEDWFPDSDLLLYRQRHENGNEQMAGQIAKHFNLPAICTDQQRNFDMYLFLTGIQQSRCYEVAINTWRQLRGVDAGSHHYTMGILYWQLNDIWQGPSWASIEWGGRWKPLQYVVKRSYSKLALSSKLEQISSDALRVQFIVVSDETSEDQRLTLKVELVPFSPAGSVAIFEGDVIATRSSATVVYNAELSAALLKEASPACTFTSCYLRATAVDRSGAVSMKYITSFVAMKYAEISSSTSINLSNFRQDSERKVSFELSVDQASPFLFLELQNTANSYSFNIHSVFNDNAGWFSDNNFFAERGVSYSLSYTSFSQDISISDIKQRLQARALQHLYNCDLPMASAKEQ